MPYVTPDLVAEARTVDLFSFLQSTDPQSLVKCGSDEYCTKEHDSLKISHGKWFWWSHGIGGKSALDYLIKVQDMDFVSAVQAVIGNVITPMKPAVEKPKCYPKLYMPPCNSDCKIVIPYLIGRGIDEEIIRDCIRGGRIREDNENGYALFVGLDEQGKPKQCSVRATDGTCFKKDIYGSDKSYSFRIISGDSSRPLRVFESAIDLLSFATLMKDAVLDYKTENLVSLAGVYMPQKVLEESKVPVAVERYLREYPDTKTIILHLDNDFAGRRGAAGMQARLGCKYKVKYVPAPAGKDFNDYLKMQKGLYFNEQKEELQGNDHRSSQDDGRC